MHETKKNASKKGRVFGAGVGGGLVWRHLLLRCTILISNFLWAENFSFYLRCCWVLQWPVFTLVFTIGGFADFNIY